jgi:hypothetical protein
MCGFHTARLTGCGVGGEVENGNGYLQSAHKSARLICNYVPMVEVAGVAWGPHRSVWIDLFSIYVEEPHRVGIFDLASVVPSKLEMLSVLARTD